MGTSPDNTDIFLAQSQNDGTSFVPENLSNDPDISFNPILSVNGTHIFVQWTDQDDNGFTRTDSKTLPYQGTNTEDNAYSNADLSGSLNSTYSTQTSYWRKILLTQRATIARKTYCLGT